MNIRSYMVVNDVEPDRFMLYVLVEGGVGDCAVYMRSYPKMAGRSVHRCAVSEWMLQETADRGGKVSIRDIDALPFKIPSHLEYRR